MKRHSVLVVIVFFLLMVFVGCEKNVTGIGTGSSTEKIVEPEPVTVASLYYQASSIEPFEYIYQDREGKFVSGSVTVPTEDLYMWQLEIPQVSSGHFSLELYGNTIGGAIYFGRDLLVSSSSGGADGIVYMFVDIKN